MSGADRTRREELDSTYREYMDDRAARWTVENPGNAAIVAERDRRAAAMLAGIASVDRVLDIGSGGSAGFGGLMDPKASVALDLLVWRLREGDRESIPAICGDGARLPVRSRTIDVVLLSTVLTSVNPVTGRAILAEAIRVLRPGGAVLIYDARYPNPANRGTRAITRRWLRRALAGTEVRHSTLTVVPQLARRLGPRADRWYGWLASVPILRSHRMTLAIRPDIPVEG